MDNEDKVKELVESSKNIFLRDKDRAVGSGDKIYSLEREFKNSKKNVSSLYYIILFGFLAFLVLASGVVVYVIQERSKNIPISVQDFKDLNLKELLDQSRGLEERLDDAISDLSILKEDKQKELQLAQIEANTQKDMLIYEDFSPEERQSKLDTINQKLASDLDKIETAFDRRIAQKEAEIAALKEDIGIKNDTLDMSAEKSEEIIDNAGKLLDIRMELQKQKFEDRLELLLAKQRKDIQRVNAVHKLEVQALVERYNPAFEDPEYMALVASLGDLEKAEFSQTAMPETYKSLNNISASDWDDGLNNIEKQMLLWQRLNKIKYTNSIPTVLQSLQSLQNRYLSFYNQVIEDTDTELALRDRQIVIFTEGVSMALEKLNVDGLVLSTSVAGNVYVYIDDIFRFSEGTEVVVYRGGQEAIADAKIYKNETGYYLRSIKNRSGKSIAVFDSLLIYQ